MKDRAERHSIHQKLYDAVFPDMSDVDQKDTMLERVTSVPQNDAVELMRFIERRSFSYNDLAIGVRDIIESQPEPTQELRNTLQHFDLAVSLGWKYAPAAFTLIVDALGSDSDLSREQAHALVLLEDSQWNKKYRFHGGEQTRRYTCAPSFKELASARPDDIRKIIPLAHATYLNRRNASTPKD